MSTTEIATEESLTARAGRTMASYREELLRKVAAKFIRPRAMWTVDQLRERMVDALDDPVTLDRALRNITPAGRQLLRLIDLSQQPVWRLQSLADLLVALGHSEGVGPIIDLLETGLAFPMLEGSPAVESFDAWLAPAASVTLKLFFVPLAAERCRTESFGWTAPPAEKRDLAGLESDGLEVLLRLAVLWQIVAAGPIRLTQGGGLFKRDVDRMRGDALLSSTASDVGDPSLNFAIFTVELGRALGTLVANDDQLVTGPLPECWSRGLSAALQKIWSAIFLIEYWDPESSFALPQRVHFESVAILLVAALVDSPAQRWHSIADLTSWLVSRNPDWGRCADAMVAPCHAILLGLLQLLRIVELGRDGHDVKCRLTALGRSLLLRTQPTANPVIAQTLLVQPNLEVILYRQGLTPALIATLTRFAEWRSLGLACTLRLTAESVYRGLETGQALATIQRTLERHATRPLPDAVVEMLRSWASKRERVQVYPSAILLEFRTAEELDQAVKGGLVEQKLTDRIGMVADEGQIDFTKFRLVGTRDYLAPEEKCIEIENDGLTIAAQDGRADLLFSAEVRRFTDVIDPAADDKSLYRMSIGSLRRAREAGVDLHWLDDWFLRRSGEPLPATARILFLGRDVPASSLRKVVILRAPSSEVADGIAHWPEAERLKIERLGPTTFAVPDDEVPALHLLLASADLRFEES